MELPDLGFDFLCLDAIFANKMRLLVSWMLSFCFTNVLRIVHIVNRVDPLVKMLGSFSMKIVCIVNRFQCLEEIDPRDSLVR